MGQQFELLRDLIAECLLAEGRRTHVIDYEKKDEEYRDSQEDRNKPRPEVRGLTPNKEFERLSGQENDEFEERIELAMADDETQNVEAYVEWALDNDVDSFDAVTLQAIARNISGQPHPGATIVGNVKSELMSYGLKRAERPKLDRSRRGFNDPAHGRHPFADSVGGGSGMGKDASFGGESMGFGIGAGKGAMGSGTNWSASDPKNLSMGSKRR
jgi:hypothetical protein